MPEHLINDQAPWSSLKRAIWLFGAAYLFLYMFPFPLDQIPLIRYLAKRYSWGINHLTLWTAAHLLQLPPLAINDDIGSGDATFDYVKLLTCVLLAALAAAATLLFARKKNWANIHPYLVVYCRYYVGLYMLNYGISKLDNGQFPAISLDLLEQKIGDSSPMRLLWIFMGYSTPYTIFTGIMEVAAGFLLLFKRTATLGCLFTIMVMANVVMMNLCYDVPVKIFSTHLLLIAIFIVLPNIKRLYDFFIRHRQTALTLPEPYLPKPWMRRTEITVRTLFIMAVCISTLQEDIPGYNEEKSWSAALNAVYETNTFVVNKDTVRSCDDNRRWNYLMLEDGSAEIAFKEDSLLGFRLRADTMKHIIHLKSVDDSTANYSLHYKALPGNYVSMSGRYQSDSISVLFKKKTRNEYRLIKRRFHWINEYPYLW